MTVPEKALSATCKEPDIVAPDGKPLQVKVRLSTAPSQVPPSTPHAGMEGLKIRPVVTANGVMHRLVVLGGTGMGGPCISGRVVTIQYPGANGCAVAAGGVTALNGLAGAWL